MAWQGKGMSRVAYDSIAGTGMGSIGSATVSTNKNSTSAKIREKQNKNRKKKKLNYNSREISSQILRSVKSEIASIVLIRAKVKVGVLKRCFGTGEYNDREVIAAITHAQRMVNCAKMKVNHLKEEEQQGHSNKKEQAKNKQQKRNEIKRKVSQKERELENKIEQEKMEQVRKEKMNHQELIRKKKMHRNRELSKIQEADMKYLKDQADSNRTDTSFQTDYSGVSLELSMAAMGLQELQLSAHAAELMEKQLEQEIEMQIEMQMQAEGISSTACLGADTSAVQDTAVDGAVPTMSFDVSI